MQHHPVLVFFAGLGVVLMATNIGGDVFGVVATVAVLVGGSIYFGRQEARQLADMLRKEGQQGVWMSADVPDVGRIEVFHTVEFSLSSARGYFLKFRRVGETSEFPIDSLPPVTQDYLQKLADIWTAQRLEIINRAERK